MQVAEVKIQVFFYRTAFTAYHMNNYMAYCVFILYHD
jgi:hypothetical protein